MRAAPIVTSLVVLCAAFSGAFNTAAAQDSSALHGGWIVASTASSDGEVNSEPQRGLFMFTATGQYSIMYVNTSEPRADLSAEPTDAEVVAAYNSFTANSGRYTVNGTELTYEAYMAKHPNYMHAFMTDEDNGQTLGWSVDDGMLTLTYASGAVVTLRRPGGGN